jgi:predicted nuclease of predicted toxin-antitoxin system
VRFLTDMGVSMGVVRFLRGQGHDVVHLRDEGLHRLPDEQIFEKAREEERVVLTFDLDFGEIVALAGSDATSVIVFRLRDARTPAVIGRLQSVLRASSREIEEGAVVVVEDGRHRVRRLPIGR